MKFNADEVVSVLKAEIETYRTRVESREVGKVLEVSSSETGVLAALAQPVLRIVSNRLEHAEAGTVLGGLDNNKVLVGQRGQDIQQLTALEFVAAAHALGRLQRPASGKHGSTSKHRPFGLAQEIVAPVDQRS